MQLPRQLSDLLMLIPSNKPCPVVWAVSVFSEPAKSTKVILEVDFLSAWLNSSVNTDGGNGVGSNEGSQNQEGNCS